MFLIRLEAAASPLISQTLAAQSKLLHVTPLNTKKFYDLLHF